MDSAAKHTPPIKYAKICWHADVEEHKPEQGFNSGAQSALGQHAPSGG